MMEAMQQADDAIRVEDEEWCFCYEEKNSDFFPLSGCPHSFHTICLRQLLRTKWADDAKTVDELGRRTVNMTCALCRKPVLPEDVRRLQRQRRLLCVYEHVTETDPSATYSITVTEQHPPNRRREEEEPPFSISQRFLAGDLPTSEPQSARKLLLADFEVVAASPMSDFHVSVQKEAPTWELISELDLHSRLLPSLEDDAYEEKKQEADLARFREAGALRVDVAPSVGGDRSPQSSPPLPTIQEVFGGSFAAAYYGNQGPPPPSLTPAQASLPEDSAAQTPRAASPVAGPSSVDDESSYWQSPAPPRPKRRFTEEERRENKRMRLAKSQSVLECKINNNLKAAEKTVNGLMEHVKKWSALKKQTECSAAEIPPGLDRVSGLIITLLGISNLIKGCTTKTERSNTPPNST